VVDLDPGVLRGWRASEPVLITDTPTSRVSRVRMADGGTAIVKDLKPTAVEEERSAADYLAWREGQGCVRLLARSGSTLLLEDAGQATLLAHLERHGDAAATGIMADAVTAIHRPARAPVPSGLQTLEERFASLLVIARRPDVDPLLVAGSRIARALLDDQRDVRPLHGDLHHENLLLAPRGWLAIDPKGLLGDPVYDVANMFYNPLARDDLRRDPDRIGSMAHAFAEVLDRDPSTILRYAFAHACLSAAWHTEDGDAAKASGSLGVAAAIQPLIERRAI
jgi:streptomycin 6-kinase